MAPVALARSRLTAWGNNASRLTTDSLAFRPEHSSRQRKGDAVTILMIIGGIVILLSVLAVGMYVYHAYRWGPCWANFDQEMGEIEKVLEQKLKLKETPESVTVTMGECVTKLVFLNKKDLDDLKDKVGRIFSEQLKCPEGKGFIIGIPYFEETKSGLKFWLWPKALLENLARKWQEKARVIDPLCRPLGYEVTPLDIDGPGEGKAKMVCMTAEKIKSGEDPLEYKFKLDYREGACA